MSASIGTDLTQGSVWKKLLRFAAPFMLANLLQTLYTLVDSIVVGQFVGADGLSAISTCSELIQFYTFIAIGFGGAGQTMIGQFIGAGAREKIRNTIGTLFTTLLLMALCITILCFCSWSFQLHLIKVPDEAFDMARNYFLVCAAGMVFIFGYNLVSAILRGMGDSKHPLLFIAIASSVNVVLDLLFVAVFHMGTAGAALATILGQAVSFIWALIFLYHRKEAFGFDFRFSSFRPTSGTLRVLMQLGIPMAAQGSLISVSMLYVYSLINQFGVAASAANGIQMRLANINRIVTTSLGTAGSAMIAQCIGAEKLKRAKSVFKWEMLFAVLYAACFSGILLLLPHQVFRIFTTDNGVLAYAVMVCFFCSIDNFGGALRAPCNSMISGTGAAVLGMFISIMDGVVARIGFSVLFGNVLGMGIAGYWLGNTLAGFVSVLFGLPYCLSSAWKKKRINL